jgi:hypothetical protein
LKFKASPANSSPDSILKNPSEKRAGRVGPEFKPQYCKKLNKNKRKKLLFQKYPLDTTPRSLINNVR